MSKMMWKTSHPDDPFAPRAPPFFQLLIPLACTEMLMKLLLAVRESAVYANGGLVHVR